MRWIIRTSRTPRVLLLALLGLGSCPGIVFGEKVSLPEAQAVAGYWIRFIEEKDGAWGEGGEVSLGEVSEIRSGDRLLGYLARVAPRGSIVISPLKELAPVKAYSTRTDFDLTADRGPGAVIRTALERTIRGIEQAKGPLDVLGEQSLGRVVERSHREDWEEVLQGLPRDYAEGEVLLASQWGQNVPYNEQCPDLGCEDPANGRAVVGCVATAASQIMRYWCWPPYGEGDPYNVLYDWTNMPDVLETDSPPEEIVATSELCHKVGLGAGTDYGCDGSDAWLGDAAGADMTDAYKDHFRYHDNVDFEMRWHWSTESWYDMIKENLNGNRPLQYGFFGVDWGGFAGHSMVCDGWSEFGGSRYIHLNYGWNGSWDYFYEIDDLHNVGWGDWEGLIRKIKPEVAEGPTIADGVHDPASSSFPPYGYFDQDATGNSAVYDAGYHLQFLPGVRVICASTTGGVLEFHGAAPSVTRIFTRGDISKGILVNDGVLRLHTAGGIRFH